MLNLDPIRFLRRRQRFRYAVDEEVALLRRRYGDAAAEQVAEKLARSDLTTRYRQILEAAAKKLRH